MKGIIHSERTNESTTRSSEKARRGFISEAVLMPEVRIMIISFPLTMRMRSISIEIRKDRGRIR